MTHFLDIERSRFVQQMFARISRSYDTLNRIMTFGQDMKWRKDAAQALALNADANILDLGSGTGDMILEVIQQYPEATVVGVDFTPEMIQLGRTKKELERVLWVIADVHSLPFPESIFNGTISAFLMRNLSKVGPAFEEQHRVLRSEGRLVCLETTPPPKNIFYPFAYLYLKWVIPLMGTMITRERHAYSYLADSTTNFIPPEKLNEKLASAGFREILFFRRMLGLIAIHSAQKA